MARQTKRLAISTMISEILIASCCIPLALKACDYNTYTIACCCHPCSVVVVSWRRSTYLCLLPKQTKAAALSFTRNSCQTNKGRLVLNFLWCWMPGWDSARVITHLQDKNTRCIYSSDIIRGDSLSLHSFFSGLGWAGLHRQAAKGKKRWSRAE